MRLIWLFLTGILAMVPGVQAQYAFATLQVPGATQSEAYGISGNNIVGYFKDATGTHGFLYNGSSYVTLDVPGAIQTYATGISGNTIAGYYQIIQNSSSVTRGFTYVSGTYTTNLNAPGATGTYFFGVDGTNVAGYTGNGGFVFDGSTYTNVNVPGASATEALGIAASGIVGFYRIGSGQEQGFFFNGSTFSTVDYPGALLTQAYGLENSTITGSYLDTNTYNLHGFAYHGSTFTALNFPGASDTSAYGISGGKIVGSYSTNSSVTYSFLATPVSDSILLKLTRSTTNVILHWTNSAVGYTLQSSTNLAPGAAWVNISTTPGVVNGEYAVTNAVAGKAKYFRLIQ